jgi:L-threonylcarbamoyladenylate synthase
VSPATRFAYLEPHSASGLLTLADAERVAASLRAGSLAVLPTETGYMLAALATSIAAVELAFRAKGRINSHVMHVACASLEMAARIGVLDDRARRVLGDFTPGPVTVVVDQTPVLPDRLVTMNGTVGIRVPDYPATLQVISAVGAPLTATSFNASGAASGPLESFDLSLLDWPDGTVHIVRDDAAITCPAPSTLVRLSGGSVEILRPGPVSAEQIRRALARPLESAARS